MLRISASQLGTFWQCPRKWYFERKLRLQQPKKSYFCFGTVLHSVAERWGAADDQGRVPYDTDFDKVTPWLFNSITQSWADGPLEGQKFGDKVDIYPEDWRWSRDWDGNKEQEVDDQEAEWIQELINEAINKGIMIRWNGRTLERAIKADVIPGVKLIGFIDVDIVDPETNVLRIKDYKTFSNSGARYLKISTEEFNESVAGMEHLKGTMTYDRKMEALEEKWLGSDTQQNIYAHVRAVELGKEDEEIEVSHIQFPKFRKSRKGVRSVEAMTTPKGRAELWRRIQDTAAKMIDVKAGDSYEELLPEDDKACQAYGGCPYASICAGIETVEQYSVSIKEHNELSQEERDRSSLPRVIFKPHAEAGASEELQELEAALFGGQSKKQMSNIFSKKGKAKSSASKERTTPVKEKESTCPNPAYSGIDMPWADPDCPLCKGVGVQKGRPCKICDATAAKRGVDPSSSFNSEELDAFLSMVGADPMVEEKAARKAEVKEIVEEVKQEEIVEEVEPEEVPQSEEVSPEPEPVKSKPKAKDKAPRKKKGPLLMVNCFTARGSVVTTTIQEVLAEYGGAMAEKAGKPYHEINAFQRRDALAGVAEAIADEIGTVAVLCLNMDPDCAALVSALTPFCRIHQGV